MFCGYGVRLQSHQKFFRPPLSEFSGSAPASDVCIWEKGIIQVVEL